MQCKQLDDDSTYTPGDYITSLTNEIEATFARLVPDLIGSPQLHLSVFPVSSFSVLDAISTFSALICAFSSFTCTVDLSSASKTVLMAHFTL